MKKRTGLSSFYDIKNSFNLPSHMSIYPAEKPYLDFTSLRRQKDRYSFYWKEGKPNDLVDTWTFECIEFRHKLREEVFDVNLFFPFNAHTTGGTLICTVTASNLPTPAQLIVPLKIEYSDGDIMKEALRLLDFKNLLGLDTESSSD